MTINLAGIYVSPSEFGKYACKYCKTRFHNKDTRNSHEKFRCYEAIPKIKRGQPFIGHPTRYYHIKNYRANKKKV